MGSRANKKGRKKRTEPDYLKKFRIFPDLHWMYFDVLIHRSKKDMHKATKSLGTMGLCRSWLTIFNRKINGFSYISQPKIGEIHLYGKPGIGITSHEICHAVHHYFWVRRRVGKGPLLPDFKPTSKETSSSEEDFCWVLGEMIRQFCILYHGGTKVRRWPRKMDPIRKGSKIKLRTKNGK